MDQGAVLTEMTDDPTEAEIAAIHERMCQPLSRERIVATELQLYLDLTRPKDLSLWTDEDWLRFARHMIECVDHARDISAEDAKKAMEAPWQGPPLPTFDELG
jgi:hypothetical protein